MIDLRIFLCDLSRPMESSLWLLPLCGTFPFFVLSCVRYVCYTPLCLGGPTLRIVFCFGDVNACAMLCPPLPSTQPHNLFCFLLRSFPPALPHHRASPHPWNSQPYVLAEAKVGGRQARVQTRQWWIFRPLKTATTKRVSPSSL